MGHMVLLKGFSAGQLIRHCGEREREGEGGEGERESGRDTVLLSINAYD